MRILITGASGFIGRHLVETLRHKGHELVLISRRERGRWGEGVTWRVVDFAGAQRPEDWLPLLADVDVDVVVNCVGIFSQTRRQRFDDLHDKAPRALFAACEQAGVELVIQISALGTDETARSPYHLSKKRADDALAASALDWVILRPSLIIGDEGVSWRFFQALSALPLVPVIGDGQQILQPISIKDVTKAILLSIERKEAVRQRIDLVGGEQVTLRQYLQKLSCWTGKKSFHPLHIPYGLAGVLAGLAPLLGKFPLDRQAIKMLREARAFSGETCRRALGFSPEGLSHVLAQNPASRCQRREARQTFLFPLLRLSLAFMWIMAGVASLFLTPQAQSLALLQRLGLEGMSGVFALYGAALLDMALGLALLLHYRVRQVGQVQMVLILFYTLALSFVAPHMWADPFGGLAKNFPVLVATSLMISQAEG